MKCDHCQSEAVVVAPGQDGEDYGDLFAISRAVPDRCWCLKDAVAAGWPWLTSETSKRRKKREANVT